MAVYCLHLVTTYLAIWRINHNLKNFFLINYPTKTERM